MRCHAPDLLVVPHHHLAHLPVLDLETKAPGELSTTWPHLVTSWCQGEEDLHYGVGGGAHVQVEPEDQCHRSPRHAGSLPDPLQCREVLLDDSPDTPPLLGQGSSHPYQVVPAQTTNLHAL